MHDNSCDFENVTPEMWMSNEKGWRERLLQLPNLFQIPLINCNASHLLSDKKLVRFKGMIQDMHNPEFYFDKFEVYNTVTHEVKHKTGKYRDTANVMENEKINYTENFEGAQRQTMVVVSMPGLNDWAEEIEDQQNSLKHLVEQPNTSKRLSQSNIKLKRSYDEAEDDSDGMDVAEMETANKEMKKTEKDKSLGTMVSREHLLNFPLPDMPSKSCIVKIYHDYESLKVNDMIEVIGFLSVDPALSGEFQKEKSPFELESDVENITHNPPPSLVPRIHAVYVKTLEHCNPLIKGSIDQDSVLKEANVAREHLLKALSELLLGDQLAAEYLICHLVASVYLRQDTLTLGQFCLNISNIPVQKYPNYAKQLYDIIRQFVTKSYYLPLTIDNMNTLTLLPKKDYECNRLTSGVLQLSKHTHLVLDETKMERGTLDATGVANISALENMITNQKVEYDFKYYKMDFDSDVSVLVLSEGKSLLPSDYHVPLKPEESSLRIFDAIVEAATYYLKEDIMNTIRCYLTNIKLIKYSITDDLQFVEDDFIEMRRNADTQNPVNADDLHRLLVLARLVSLSRGFPSLNKECWDITKSMETERLKRLNNRISSTLI